MPLLNPLVTGALVFFVVGAAPGVFAQWPRYPPSGAVRTADGKIDFAAPAPRTADGKPDLSGVWETAPCSGCAPPVIDGLGGPPPPGQGRGNSAAPPPPPPGAFVFGDIGSQTQGGGPTSRGRLSSVKKRMADNSKDNPDAHCLPMGVMQLDSHPYPKKIIQTPAEVVLIYEGSGTTVRRSVSGRQGVARQGCRAVVERLLDLADGKARRSWWKPAGSWTAEVARCPVESHFTKCRKTDRTVSSAELWCARDRRDHRRIRQVHAKPFTATVYRSVMPDAQLSEFVCIDKDAGHYVGATSK